MAFNLFKKNPKFKDTKQPEKVTEEEKKSSVPNAIEEDNRTYEEILQDPKKMYQSEFTQRDADMVSEFIAMMEKNQKR